MKSLKSKLKKSNNNEKIEQQDIEGLERIVKNSVKKYSVKLGVIPKKVSIRSIKYAWGSCSSKQNITINMKLAKKEKEVIEYVVLHEMCHLIYMNHSKDFWNMLQTYMPKYKEYKSQLKEE